MRKMCAVMSPEQTVETQNVVDEGSSKTAGVEVPITYCACLWVPAELYILR